VTGEPGGDGECQGKVAFETPGAALRSMVTANRHIDREGRPRLRGIYRHGEHYHLTGGPGDRAMMRQAVDEVLASAEQPGAGEAPAEGHAR
jgi:hypothetical protein